MYRFFYLEDTAKPFNSGGHYAGPKTKKLENIERNRMLVQKRTEPAQT